MKFKTLNQGRAFMKKSEKNLRTYRVRVLDIKYQSQFQHLGLNYIYYKVKAKDKEEALEKARALYMREEKGEFNEELPFLLKLFAVETA